MDPLEQTVKQMLGNLAFQLCAAQAAIQTLREEVEALKQQLANKKDVV